MKRQRINLLLQFRTVPEIVKFLDKLSWLWYTCKGDNLRIHYYQMKQYLWRFAQMEYVSLDVLARIAIVLECGLDDVELER